MAQFPSHNDRRDVGAWEFVLNELCRLSAAGSSRRRQVRAAVSDWREVANTADLSRDEIDLVADAFTL